MKVSSWESLTTLKSRRVALLKLGNVESVGYFWFQKLRLTTGGDFNLIENTKETTVSAPD